MKPENLLIFSDYKVKLGDFGISVKIPDGSSEVYMKGLTNEYANKEMKKKCNN